MVAGFDHQWAAFLDLYSTKLLPLSRANEDGNAMDLFKGKSRELFTAADKTLGDLVEFNVHEAKETASAGEAIYASSQLWIVGALGLAVILCGFAGWSIVISVSRPITEMTDAMRRLAGRDMAVEIVGLGRKDEMADAVAVFKNSTIEADRLAAEQAAGNEAKMQRMRQLEALTQSFEATAAN
jgi:methyl-accepting chemotaxis protein